MRFIAPLTSLALFVAATLPVAQAGGIDGGVALHARHEIPRCIVDCENKAAMTACGAEGIAKAECWCKSQPFFTEAYECSLKCGLDLDEDVNHAWREIKEVCEGLQGGANSTATVPFIAAAGATPTSASNSTSGGAANTTAPVATSAPPASNSAGQTSSSSASSAPASTARPDGAASVRTQLVLVFMTAVVGSALSML